MKSFNLLASICKKFEWCTRQAALLFLPNIPITLKARKSKGLDVIPRHLGEHLRLCRLKRKLTQVEVATFVGTKPMNVLRWEKGLEPEIDVLPSILRFLGYDPFPPSKTLPERMLGIRRIMGWTFKIAAKKIGVSRKTWKSWERKESVPTSESVKLLERFLKDHSGV